MKRVKVSAPGKVILSGEHAVVYGKPEIIVAINRRLGVTVKELESASRSLVFSSQEPSGLLEFAVKKVFKILGKHPKKPLEIRVDSEIPIGSGLGSSAALAVATTASLFKFFNQTFDKERINEIAYEIEKKQHGVPSGGDNTIVTHGGFLWYRKEAEFLKLFEPLQFNSNELPEFVLINTGRPQETTGEMVAAVKYLYNRNKKKVEKFLNEIEKVTRQMLIALNRNEKKKIMSAIKKNEQLLEELEVVGPFAKKVIKEIERKGGVAKICGAGGKKKGSGILLAFHSRKEVIFELAKKCNLPAFEVKLGEEGVKVEEDTLQNNG